MLWVPGWYVMKNNRTLGALWLTLSLFAIGSDVLAADCAPPVATLVSLDGQVEALRMGTTRWQAVPVNAGFCPGDQVRVGGYGHAAVRLANNALIRLGEGTTITFERTADEPLWLRMVNGLMHFVSRSRSQLRVTTPFVNAAVEGTEFALTADAGASTVWVIEGEVRAENGQGRLVLGAGESAIAQAGQAPVRHLAVTPSDAVQWALHYPALIDMELVRQWRSDASGEQRNVAKFIEEGQLGAALRTLESMDPVDSNDGDARGLQAALLISVGRADLAASMLNEAGDVDSYAQALRSIVAVTRNDATALELAEAAVRADPRSPMAQQALSYAMQSVGRIDGARNAAAVAVELVPHDAAAWARLAELELAVGHVQVAAGAAQRSLELGSHIPRAHVISGFVYLIQMRTDVAAAAFSHAIALDQSDPLPWLGLALAKIRRGDDVGGRTAMEVARSLDPGHSLTRSYLAKVYNDQGDDQAADTELRLAALLDRNDPTPHLYGALIHQAANRPNEALTDLRESIVRNDNRQVFRSGLLLDRDLAARSVSLAGVYDDLGFDNLAALGAARATAQDPANSSGHRLLAAAYAARNRHEVARVSEQFQAQMLQPLAFAPLQPSQQFSDLKFAFGNGAGQPSFNEYTALLEKDGARIDSFFAAGDDDRFVDEVVVSAVFDRVAWSVGQFHHESSGFRPNNDVQEDIITGFFQVAVTPTLSMQLEHRRLETEQGDLVLDFDPNLFSLADRRDVKQQSTRYGVTLSPDERTSVLLSVIRNDRDSGLNMANPFAPIIAERETEKGLQIEAQGIYRGDRFNAVFGGGDYDIDSNRVLNLDFTPVFGLPCLPFLLCEERFDFQRRHRRAYGYANAELSADIVATVGLSYDDYEQESLDIEVFNHKLGLTVAVTDWASLRLASFAGVKQALVVDQTLEPTAVAGFNQLFDDITGSATRRHGVGIDIDAGRGWYGGFEVSRREIERPSFLVSGGARITDQTENLYRGYVYWADESNWSVSLSGEFEGFKSEDDGSLNSPLQVDTFALPLAVKRFGPGGFFASLTATYVDQSVGRRPDSLFPSGDDEFVVVDAALGYRFKKRRGFVSIEAKNLFDKSFSYQDSNFRSSRIRTPKYVPDSSVLVKLGLRF